MEETREVVGWYAAPVTCRDRAWSDWLHGRVAAVRAGERLLLVVPVPALTPAATALALRLFELGAYDVLDGADAPAA